MQILELEEKYSELKSDLSGQISKRTKLLKISGYFGIALSTPNSKIIEPYIVDLIPEFLKYANDLEIRGLHPDQIELLINQITQLKQLIISGIDEIEYIKVVQSLEEKNQLMKNWLEPIQESKHQPKIYFPLLEKNDDKLGNGYLESVNVIIKSGEQNFHISPADLENDELLEKQIQLCFEKALEFCSQHIKKIKKAHTVYLHFENRLGILTGISLGAALTVSFIEAILKHYNSPIVVSINKTLAITGGISEDSKIISTSKTIIEAKVETVFYSAVELMCVPKIDEIWAEEKLKQLKENYPNRSLKIIGLIDLNDLLDRRQIVEIKKQPIIKRTGKFVKKNWISAIVTVLLAILFAYLFVMDFDHNPASISSDGVKIYIKNKSGKTLWTRITNYGDVTKYSGSYLNKLCRVVDVNKDNINEVLIAGEIFDIENPEIDLSAITCFDNEGKLIWIHKFEEEVNSKREKLEKYYGLLLIDTLTIKGNLAFFIIAGNQSSFSSAIYSINSLTGKKLKGTFWCSGHIIDALITDINNDDKKDIVAVGVDNGYEQQTFFAFEIDSNYVSRKTTEDYYLYEFPEAKMLTYIRFPKTDLDKHLDVRIPGVTQGSFYYNEAQHNFNFATETEDRVLNSHLWIGVKKDLSDINVIVDNRYRVLRDTLVVKGKLNLPYTDTDEFKQDYKNKILYLNEKGEWVNKFAK